MRVLNVLHDKTALYINLPFYKMKTLNQYQIIFREKKAGIAVELFLNVIKQ